jgi:copper chaperone CopZ
VDGVKKADVEWEKGKAVVQYDPVRVTPEQLVAAIQRVGFRASVIASR